jgi:hypothetical protein
MQRSLSMVVNLKVERSKMDTRVLQQDRLAASARPSSEWFRSPSHHEPPSADPRRAAAATVPASEAAESRNERPTPPADAPPDRHNPNPTNANRPEHPNGPALDRRRTAPRFEAHPGAPGSPPDAPFGPPSGRIEPRHGA